MSDVTAFLLGIMATIAVVGSEIVRDRDMCESELTAGHSCEHVERLYVARPIK